MVHLLTIFTFFARYFKDFANPEILERRYETMTTVFLAVFIYSGFKPFFNLLSNIIIFCKNIIMGLFFKSPKQVLLEQKKFEKARQRQELLAKIEQTHQELKQIKTELEKMHK
ncbi:MAG: hypothetical protein Q8807_02655 ['Waltheria sp.' little leaf phytoplasma]|nr:hypothetical protein ['Waltheria sp.' little leaf phytoplasma]